jgi:hypothetical protein
VAPAGGGKVSLETFADGPGPPRRLSALSVSLYKSVLYGAFVWARGALKHKKRRFPARAVPVARLKTQTHEMALAACAKQGVAFPPVAETTLAVALGLGRIAALHHPSSDSHHTR